MSAAQRQNKADFVQLPEAGNSKSVIMELS